MTGTLRRVAVLGGTRIPFCRSNTLYADLSNLEMMAAALNGLADKFKLKGKHIDVFLIDDQYAPLEELFASTDRRTFEAHVIDADDPMAAAVKASQSSSCEPIAP